MAQSARNSGTYQWAASSLTRHGIMASDQTRGKINAFTTIISQQNSSEVPKFLVIIFIFK